jgi:hypothetical protein
VDLTLVENVVETDLVTITKKEEVYKIAGYPELKCRHVWGRMKVSGAEDVVVDSFKEAVSDERQILKIYGWQELIRDHWPTLTFGIGFLRLVKNNQEIWGRAASLPGPMDETYDTTKYIRVSPPQMVESFDYSNLAFFFDEDDTMILRAQTAKTGSTGVVEHHYSVYIIYVEKP